MDEPQVFQKIIRRAVKNHPDSIDDATADAVHAVYAIPASKELIRTLIEIACRRTIEQLRHSLNRSLKKSNGDYARVTPKVLSGAGAAVAKVCRSLYEYFIGGMTVGSMGCKDIMRIEKKERTAADGHQANADFLHSLKPLVTTGKTVREAVPEKKLRALMQASGVL